MPFRPLALALAAAASSQLRLEENESQIRDGLLPAVAAMDEADRSYRRTIEEMLPLESAATMLSATAAFRKKVSEVREHARREIGELYRRNNRPYGWFDPLDAHMPPTAALTHADSTRVATISDSARSQVDALRAQVNGAVTEGLSPAQIDTLLVAKRAETALKRALEAAVAPCPSVTLSEIDKAVYQLAQLADGWY